MTEIKLSIANETHLQFAEEICDMMERAAAQRGTGIAKRSPLYVSAKMMEGKAVIATSNDAPVGFCYIETWGHGKYVANSGLIIHPDCRNTGLARKIKAEIFKLSKSKYPDSKIFGITTSLAVMKINSDLGYKPTTFSELTTDEDFWKGCQSCKNYDILTRTNRAHCLCTGMIYDPAKQPVQKATKEERWQRFKRFVSINNIKEGAGRLREKLKLKINNQENKTFNKLSWLTKVKLF